MVSVVVPAPSNASLAPSQWTFHPLPAGAAYVMRVAASNAPYASVAGAPAFGPLAVFNSSAAASSVALAAPASRSNAAYASSAGLGPFSLWSDPADVNAPAPPAPLPPPRLAGCSTGDNNSASDTSCSVTASTVTLEWDAPSLEDLGGLPLLYYRLYITLVTPTAGIPVLPAPAAAGDSSALAVTGNALPLSVVAKAAAAGVWVSAGGSGTYSMLAPPTPNEGSGAFVVSVGCANRVTVVSYT
jgi:hypothetical protein